MKCILTICCSLLFFFQIHAQGWDKTLTDSVTVRAVSPTSDGGSIILGRRVFTSSMTVIKVDASGQRQWAKDFADIPTAGITPADKMRIQQDSDGNYWFGIFLGSATETTISKIDKDGNRLLLRKLTLRQGEINVLNNQLVLIGVNPTSNNITTILRLKPNGDTLSIGTVPSLRFTRSPYYVTAVKSNGLLLYHLSDSFPRPETLVIGFDGAILSKTVSSQAMFPFQSSVILPQIVKATDGSYFVPDSANVVKLSSEGQFIWRKPIAVLTPSGTSPFLFNHLITPTQDGGLISIQNNVGAKSILIRRYNGNGDLVASHYWFYTTSFMNPFTIKLAQGGILLVANQGTSGAVRLIKFGENGYFYQYFIKGNVYSDRDDNCRVSTGDMPFRRVVVTGKRTGFPDIFALTDSSGKYVMNVDAGNYVISIVKPNRYMDLICTPSVSKTISVGNPLDSADFPLKTSFYCGLMQVDVTTPRLRRCFNNNYTVNYCNIGTATATGAYVNVTLDSLLEFVSAGKPVISRTGRVYRFNLGDVAMNDCASFDIVARVRCGDSTRLNQTLCVAAKIYPDTICVPDNSLWSGASLVVSGTCQGDSVQFQVLNAGRAAAPASTSLIVENLNSTPVNIGALAVNGVFSKKYPANGNTWRMIVNQVPNHPRSTQPTAFVEGCRRNTTQPFATGFAAGFANDDADLSLDVDCQPIIGAFDPNDKVGYPLGTGVTKAIGQNQDLEYRIRFQNTGTDTAFTVVIRDTIDIANLDILSIEWGASSHPYTPEIYKENILKFTFDNILLVDSFTNEPKSNGFVKFRIKQKKDVAFGTRIQNSAGIYFDFNDPIITNKTLHTVSKDIVSAIFDKFTTTYPTVKVYPNPASATMTFELTDTPLSISTFELFDMLGKRLVTQQFNGKTFEFQRESLPTGVYVFKMTTGQTIVGTGKLMIKD